MKRLDGDFAGWVLVTALMLAATGGLAVEPEQDAPVASANDCRVHTADGVRVVVVCPAGLDQYGWKEAGTTACESVSGCIALIWDDAATAPSTLPPPGEQLSPEQASGLVAMWDNDSKMIVLVSSDQD